MKFRRFTAVMLALAPLALVVGCSDDDDVTTDVELNDVADTWTATSFVYTNDANSSQSVDLIDDFDATFSLLIEEDGDYRFTTNVPGQATDIEIGDVNILGNGRIQFDPTDSSPEVADLTLSNGDDRLVLFFEEAAFDFDDDGDEEPADLTVTLVRD